MPRIPHDSFYLKAFAKYGINPKGVCWIDQKRQFLRFSKLLEALPDDLSKTTLADAGCGFGDLYLYLQKQGISPKHYIGIETLNEFATIAKRRTKQTILHRDILKDDLPSADFYLCSGALNTLSSFETRLFLQRLFEHAKQGVVFNFLCGDKASEVYNYIEENKIYTLIEALGGEIFYKSKDYIPNDMTIGIKRTTMV